MEVGEICVVYGIEGFEIGDIIVDFENLEVLFIIVIDELMMSMVFIINDFLFFGKEGKYVIFCYIKDCFIFELECNLAMWVEEMGLVDMF